MKFSAKSPGKRSYRRRSGKSKADVPPVPPLPPIPESLRANLTPKVLGKIVKRMRSRPELKLGKVIADSVAENAQHVHYDNCVPPSAAQPNQRHSKGYAVSIATLQEQAVAHTVKAQSPRENIPFCPDSTLETMTGASDPTSPIEQVLYPSRPEGRQYLQYTISKPRLSPMEYTRLYLLEKALSARQSRRCELPAPEKQWFWTPRWESFLVIPHIPSCIARTLLPEGTSRKEITMSLEITRNEDSDAESVMTLRPTTPKPGCPRLSLNLGGMTTLFPSLMNLAALDTVGATYNTTNRRNLNDTEDVVDKNRHTGSSIDEASKVSRLHDMDIASTRENLQQTDSPLNVSSTDSSRADPFSMCATRASHGDGLESQGLVTPISDRFSPSSLPRSWSDTKVALLSSSLSSESVRTPLEYSPISFTTISGATTPLAHFPITSKHTARLTPSTVSRQVIGFAGGNIQSRDVQQAKLVRSPSGGLVQASIADVQEETEVQPLLFNRQQSSQLQSESVMRESCVPDGRLEVPPHANEESNSESPKRVKSSESLAPEFELKKSQQKHAEMVAIALNEKGIGNAIFPEPTTPPQRDTSSSHTSPSTTHQTRDLHPHQFTISSNERSGFSPEQCRHEKNRKMMMKNKHKKKRQSAIPDSPTLPSVESLCVIQQVSTKEYKEPAYLARCERRFGLVPPKLLVSTEAPVRMHGTLELPRGIGRIATERPSSRTPKVKLSSKKTSKDSSFTLHRAKSHDAFTILPRLDTTYSKEESTTVLGQDVKTRDNLAANSENNHSGRNSETSILSLPDEAHRFSLQRFDLTLRRNLGAANEPDSICVEQTVERTTPSPPNRETKLKQTPSAAFGTLFRRRNRAGPERIVTTPRRVLSQSPIIHWKPLEESHNTPPCPSPWMFGGDDNYYKDMQERVGYFRENAARELAQKRKHRKEDCGNGRNSRSSHESRDGTHRQMESLGGRRVGMGSLLSWKSIVNDEPSPPPYSPVPPVPPFPSLSQLMNTCEGVISSIHADEKDGQAIIHKGKQPRAPKAHEMGNTRTKPTNTEVLGSSRTWKSSTQSGAKRTSSTGRGNGGGSSG